MMIGNRERFETLIITTFSTRTLNITKNATFSITLLELSDVMLSAVMLSVIMLSIVMLSVVYAESHK